MTRHSNENESSNKEHEGQLEKQVSNSEAVECFKKCFSWMERQNDVDPFQVMQFCCMMDLAMRSGHKTLKQTHSMLHYFRKNKQMFSYEH